jgi:hypothetical protein
VWLLVLDAIGGLLALWVGSFAAEKTYQLIMATWAILQPVFITAIAMIAVEDRATIIAAADLEAAGEYRLACEFDEWKRAKAKAEKAACPEPTKTDVLPA